MYKCGQWCGVVHMTSQQGKHLLNMNLAANSLVDQRLNVLTSI